jgi:hypothetical protein
MNDMLEGVCHDRTNDAIDGFKTTDRRHSLTQKVQIRLSLETIKRATPGKTKYIDAFAPIPILQYACSCQASKEKKKEKKAKML